MHEYCLWNPEDTSKFPDEYNLGSVNCGKGVTFLATDGETFQWGGGSFYNPATAGYAVGFKVRNFWIFYIGPNYPRINFFADADCKGFYDS